MNILITGVTGFVGSHVAQALLEKGHEVTGLVRHDEEVAALEKQGIHPAVGELADIELLKSLALASDGVVHAAASNVPGWEETNQQVVSTLLSTLRGTGKPVAMQGGTMVFGDTGATLLDEDTASFNPPPPMQGRVTLERRFLAAEQQDIRSLIIYGSYVYGGAGAAIPSIMKAAAQSHGYSAYVGEGHNAWASVHIQDWASLFVLALEQPQALGPYFAAAEVHSLKEIATMVNQATDNSSGVQSVTPEQAGELWSFFAQPLSLMNQRFSGEKAKKTLGWQPEHSLGATTI